jgi:hypothetical protein
MRTGEVFSFTVNAYGFNKTDIIWTTTKKEIVQINRETGKATAVSAGTDYVVVEAGDKFVKVKVVVS